MARSAVVQLAPGVWRVPTQGNDLVNSFALVQDDGSVTLVDCGLRRAPARIVAGLAAIGKHPADVTRIVLTHVHPDHGGGAAELGRRTGAPILVHEEEHGWAAAGRTTGAFDTATMLGRVFARFGDARFEPFDPGPALTKRTAHRLGELDYTVAALTHGPELRHRARETVRGILSRLDR